MAIDFSQVRALQIQSEAYRQLEYIKLGSNNYFNLGTASQGLYLEFDINVSVPMGATSYDFYGYNVNINGRSVNEVTIMHSGASFTYGRRDDTTVAYANIYTGPLMHNKRRVIKAYVRDDKKSVIEIYDTEGTLLDRDVSTNAYVNEPYASSNTGLFAQWEYRSSDDETKFRTIESGIFYSFKVRATEDGPLVENWLPAQRKADGAIGIYDTVNHRFLQPHITTNTTYYTYLEGGPIFEENPQWSPLVKVKQIKNANNVVLWTAAPELTSITLAGYNTSLNINSNFLYGGTVTANYSDGSTADVTLNTTFSGYDMSTAGTQTVTASYTEHGITKTATYQLTIVAAVWHTVWSGSHKFGVKWKTSSDGTHTKTGEGTLMSSGLQPNVLTKVTFTLQDVNTNTSYFSALGATSGLTDSLTSPVEFTATVLGGNLMSGLIYYTTSSGTGTRYEFAIISTANGGATISIPNIYNYSAYERASYMTITKIEQYY